MDELLRASVIIPTYNRADDLVKCLAALAQQTVAPQTFEILVVDNASTDHTATVVQTFAEAHPELCVRYVVESRQGAGYARNRALMETQGSVLCFLDDDAVANPAWLERLLVGFVDPSVGCVGGPAIPDYQGRERPAWLAGDLQGLLSGYVLPYTQPTVVMICAEFPFACNMALRRSLFETISGFRPDLDRVGRQLLTGGETELIGRVQQADWKVIYLPEAHVRHLVAPDRLAKDYIFRIGHGIALSHMIRTTDGRLLMALRWFASDIWHTIRLFVLFCTAVLARKPLWYDDYVRFWIVALRVPYRVRLLLRRELT